MKKKCDICGCWKVETKLYPVNDFISNATHVCCNSQLKLLKIRDQVCLDCKIKVCIILKYFVIFLPNFVHSISITIGTISLKFKESKGVHLNHLLTFQ